MWLSHEPPTAAKVGVWRKDFAEPVWGVARTGAYAAHDERGQLQGLWRTMADTMIAKCAEALAIRKAFPQELSGVYTGEEMEQAEPAIDHATGEIQPARKAPSPKPARAERPAATPAPLQHQRAKVLGVVQRPLDDGRVKFVISLDDLKSYGTFKREDAETAKAAQAAGLPIEITYTPTPDGRMIQALREITPEGLPDRDAEPPL